MKQLNWRNCVNSDMEIGLLVVRLAAQPHPANHKDIRGNAILKACQPTSRIALNKIDSFEILRNRVCDILDNSAKLD